MKFVNVIKSCITKLINSIEYMDNINTDMK